MFKSKRSTIILDMKYFLLILFSYSIIESSSFSQTSPITFGAVTRNDLETELYPQEKGAEAVVLCDYSSARLTYHNGFKIEISRHVRIKIFKPAGYDFGNVLITYGKNDLLTGLKASTYNLVDGLPVEIPVGKKQFFLENTNLYQKTTRFAFPQVREGSVIEYTYNLSQGEIRKFVPFSFQRSIPVRHVECWASYPVFFNYTVNFRGNDKILQTYKRVEGFYNTQGTDFHIYEWTGNHLPPLQPEPNMPESDDYVPGVSFALSSVTLPDGGYFEVAPSYQSLSNDMLTVSDFGRQLSNLTIFSKEVKEIIAGKGSPGEQAEAIYNHVKARIKWNGMEYLEPYEHLRIAYRDKTGNNADINAILINMLRTAGIKADPVVLSTRENGALNPFVALASDLNYMICLVYLDDKEILLDATDRFRPMGMLPFRCLNKDGWVLKEQRGRWIPLLNEAEKKASREYYDLYIDVNGKITGTASITLEGYDAMEYRRLIYNQTEKGIREEKMTSIGNMKVSDITAKNIDNINEPLMLSFSMEFDHMLQSGAGLYFFQPVHDLFSSLKSTWIKDERVYPIDLGCPISSDIRYVYHLPDSFMISELPQSLRLVLPNREATFSYQASGNARLFTVATELNVSKTWFNPEEYPALREFFTQILKKTNEMVIIK